MIHVSGAIEFDQSDRLRFFLDYWKRVAFTLYQQLDPASRHIFIAFHHPEWSGPAIERVKASDAAIRICHDSERNPSHPFDFTFRFSSLNNLMRIESAAPGLRPIYYFRKQSLFVYSTDLFELRKLLGQGTPDPIATASLIGLGRIVGNRTLCQEIRRLPEGNVHIIRRECIESFIEERLPIGDPIKADVCLCAARFRKALDHRLESPTGGTWIPLSGGLDSRAVLSCVSRPGIVSYTRGSRRSDEAGIAAQAAGVMSLPHYHFEFPRNYLEEFSQRIIRSTGGSISIDDSHAMYPCDTLRDRGAQTVIPGIGGEYGRNFWKISGSDDESGDDQEALGRIIFAKENRLDPKCIQGSILHYEDALQTMEEEYLDGFMNAAKQSLSASKTTVLDEFYLFNRIRTFTIFGSLIWGRYFHVILPFLEPSYLAAIRRLPAANRQLPSVHAKILDAGAPKLASIRLEPSGNIPANGFKPSKLWLMSRFLRRMVPGMLLPAQNYIRLLRNSRRFVEEILYSKREDLDAIVSIPRIRKTWRQKRLSRRDAQQISRFMTVALFWENR